MQLEGFSCSDEVRQGSHAHLLRNMTPMDLDGDFTQPEFSRHLFVHEPCRDKRHDFSFAWRKRFKTLAEFRKPLVAIPSLPVPFDRLRDSIAHVLIAERLRQKIDSSSFHSPDGHGDAAMASHHDDGDMNVLVASWVWKSRPLTPGSLMSSTRQHGASGNLCSNSSATDGNNFDSRLTDRNKRPSASRSEGSSSTTRTTGVSGASISLDGLPSITRAPS